MVITEQVLRTGGAYPIDHVANEYEVKEGVRFKIRKTTYGLAKQIDTMPASGSMEDTLAMCKMIAVAPDGWNWEDIPEDVEFGMFARMVSDFLLPAAGLYFRPRSG